MSGQSDTPPGKITGFDAVKGISSILSINGYITLDEAKALEGKTELNAAAKRGLGEFRKDMEKLGFNLGSDTQTAKILDIIHEYEQRRLAGHKEAAENFKWYMNDQFKSLDWNGQVPARITQALTATLQDVQLELQWSGYLSSNDALGEIETKGPKTKAAIKSFTQDVANLTDDKGKKLTTILETDTPGTGLNTRGTVLLQSMRIYAKSITEYNKTHREEDRKHAEDTYKEIKEVMRDIAPGFNWNGEVPNKIWDTVKQEASKKAALSAAENLPRMQVADAPEGPLVATAPGAGNQKQIG